MSTARPTPENDIPGRFRCPVCGCAVTRSPSDPTLEYGHRAKANNGREPCSRRPDVLDTSDPRADHESHLGTAVGRDEQGRFAAMGGSR